MSTPPPPPGYEPPGSSGPPPPPAPPGAVPPPPATPPGVPPHTATPPGAPPPGYVAYGTPMQMQGGLQTTRGLRLATVILIWVATVGTLLQFLTVFNRRTVWDDPSSSLSDLIAADDAVAASTLFYLVAVLAAGIVLSIWTLRSVRNSQRLGTRDLKPGLACGGWYIPFGNVFVPFIQIRRATAGVAGRTVAVTLWQIAWGFMVLGGTIVNTAFSETNLLDPEAVRADLNTQVTGSGITLVAAVVAAIAATLATKALDDAVEARAGG